MKSNRSLFVALLSVCLALPLAAQVNDTYVIPAAINAAGSNNTRWTTELSIFNPQKYPLRVTMVYLPTGVGIGERVDFNVGSNVTAYADNVLNDLFARSGTGSLLIATFPDQNPTVPNTIVAQSFLVNTRTYNNSSGGTFGQSIRGLWVGLQDIDLDGISAIAPGLRNSTSSTSGYRTNIGAVNLGRSSVTLRVGVFDAEGRAIAEGIPFIVPPEGHMQDRLPVELSRGSVEFWVEGDAFQNDAAQRAVVFPYTSMVDNRSGDPVYVEPVLTAPASSLYAKSKDAQTATRLIGTSIDGATATRIAQNAVYLGEAFTVKTEAGHQLHRK